ncbi:hypothetical protein JTE90_015644 [Oedothorax gibbosus]|uniref:MADF domain-containing protein n=1 Tax=Oedothorax gibbosus TaxID=931172 RepID=A0AAV6UTX9_9ARAC|nr:hypothetical protein JTE90_015644 [Oedothorax gibbosus]
MAKNCSPNPIPDNEAWRIFFDVYRNLPELWDENCTFYKSKHRRQKAYAKLLGIYKMICKGATHGALTKRLLNIKRCYRREMKKVKKFENVGEKYIPSLWYFGLLKSIFSPGASMAETSVESDRDTSVGVECCLMMMTIGRMNE